MLKQCSCPHRIPSVRITLSSTISSSLILTLQGFSIAQVEKAKELSYCYRRPGANISSYLLSGPPCPLVQPCSQLITLHYRLLIDGWEIAVMQRGRNAITARFTHPYEIPECR